MLWCNEALPKITQGSKYAHSGNSSCCFVCIFQGVETIMKLYNGDCLDVMQIIPDKSIDMILCDLPYGTTACKWDTIIPFAPLWEQYSRIIKLNGCIALFGTEPFSSALRMSNIKNYKYDWIWEKGRASGFIHAKNKPLKAHEIISIFSNGTTVHKSQSSRRMIYNPQMNIGKPYTKKITKVNTGAINHIPAKSEFDFVGTININDGTRYPRSVLKFSMHNVGNFHPTQKPVELLEYLINTYTENGSVVLDNCMGSGSTGVACVNTGRDFIGIELDKTYFNIAEERINDVL